MNPDRSRHTVEEYLAGVGEPHRSTLLATRATLRSILPRADEAMKYGMPTFLVCGKSIASYAAFKAHCTFFPHSGEVVTRAGKAIAAYGTSKGGVRFPADRPLPKAIVKRLVRLRLDELGDTTDGKRFELYDDGTVRAAGSMKAGRLHGAWRFYRKDGSLMRAGAFRHGEQTGAWQTFDARGRVVTTRQF
jgi:uncharacterized protein YdhG (YjbR/CyaY superfamily)